jgi:hypothetical protein
MIKKDTNPKEALGIRKVPMHVVPTKPLMALGLAMMEGGRKYGAHNYREMGVRFSTYYDAAMRHLMSWWEGEDIDPESGVFHVVKAMACLTVLMDSIYMNNYTDDRPIRYPNGIDMDSFNKAASSIIDAYPECKKGYYQIGKTKIDTKNSDHELNKAIAEEQEKKVCEICGSPAFFRSTPESAGDGYPVGTLFCGRHVYYGDELIDTSEGN